MKNKLFLIALTLLISSCGGSVTDPSTSSGDPTTSSPSTEVTTSTEETTSSPTIKPQDSLIFISEVYGSGITTRAIEIASTNLSEVNISNYRLDIYSGKRLQFSHIFENVTLKSNEVYVLANKDNDEFNYHQHADFIFDGTYLNGSNYIELVNDEGVVVDVIGSQFKYEYATYKSYLKFPDEYKSSLEYDQLHYLNVRTSESYSYLGNLDFPSVGNNIEEFLETGPKLTEDHSLLPFETDTNSPGGGFTPVTVSSYGDGDTTVFRFKEEFVSVENTERTRYMYINTPEISHYDEPGKEHIGAEPWGYAAKEFNNNALKGATSILLQSVRGGSFRETYGRLLGFVWYATEQNPTLSDYKLLNFEEVKLGYAYFGDGETLDQMYSDEIYYHTYFELANLYATKLGLKIHGEKDPDFDY